jgi:hypothetical protein
LHYGLFPFFSLAFGQLLLYSLLLALYTSN